MLQRPPVMPNNTATAVVLGEAVPLMVSFQLAENTCIALHVVDTEAHPEPPAVPGLHTQFYSTSSTPHQHIEHPVAPAHKHAYYSLPLAAQHAVWLACLARLQATPFTCSGQMLSLRASAD
jgi:hypothetical protein